MGKIALCVIATNNYIDFVDPLLKSADRYFLDGHYFDYHLFTNMDFDIQFERPLFRHQIAHESWPLITLHRYHTLISCKELWNYDAVFYIDADMLFVAPVGDEILNDLTAVAHPGYYISGKGSWETNKQSTAYTPQTAKPYICGGFQGGYNYMVAANAMKMRIDIDAASGVTAVWHDESHWNNYYAAHQNDFTILNPSYCHPDSEMKAENWGIHTLQKKILALEKNHKNYQK